MSDRTGIAVTVVASALFLAVLLAPYAVEPAENINSYYVWGLVNPLYAGVLVVALLAVIAAVHLSYVSGRLGAGLGVGISLLVLLTAGVWAITAREDVFLAPGWAIPVQRFVLVAIAALLVVSTAYYAAANDRAAADD